MTCARRTFATTAAAALVATACLTSTAPTARAKPPVETPRVSAEHVSLSSATSSERVAVGKKTYTIAAEVNQTATHPFQIVGFTWASQTGQVSVQYRLLHGSTWTDWDTLDVDPTEGGRPGTDPVYADRATGVQARVITSDGGTVSGARATLIDPEQVPSDSNPQTISPSGTSSTSTTTTSPTNTSSTRTTTNGSTTNGSTTAGTTTTASGYVPEPTVISRAGWGADESLLSTNGADCVPPNYDTTIRAVIVHHTAGSNDYTKDQSASIVRGIYRFHVVDRGWCDIGYNALIDKYGQIFEGRHGGLEYPVHGAHATLWNTDTFGVSVMMDSNTAAVTAETKTALVKMISWKLANNYRAATGTVTLAGKTINIISGHRDVMQTDCPGTNLYAYLPTLRSQVSAALGTTTTLQARWKALGGETGTLGSPHILERDLLGGRVVDFTGGSLFLNTANQVLQLNAPMAERARQEGYEKLGFLQGDPVARSGGVVATFPNGEIDWSTTTHAALVVPPVRTYLADHPDVSQMLGLAVADQTRNSSGALVQQFQHGSLVQSSTGAFTVVTGRIADTLADVIAIDKTAGNLWWIPSTGVGSTGGTAVQIGRGWGSTDWLAQLPDVNGDGLTELLARRTDGTLWYYRSDPNGGLAAGKQIGHGWGGMRQMVIMDDLNGDGGPELLAVASDERLLMYSFSKDATVVTGPTVVGRNWGAIGKLSGVSDYLGAGQPGLVAIDSQGRLLAYAVSPTGQTSLIRQVGQNWGGMTRIWSPGDVNADGRADLLGLSADGVIHGYSNAGNLLWGWTGPWSSSASDYRLVA